ncbi:10117_t:CDS:2, partial [Entrophospora sp. SA101]
CAENDGAFTLKADNNSPETLFMSFSALKNLSIPETVYDAIVSLPSAKFQKVCHDMTVTGKTDFPLSEQVRLCLSEEIPLLVGYTINSTSSFL